MASRRYFAAGISHARSNMIFGGSLNAEFHGYGSGTSLSSTEIITEQGVSAGPEMPEAVRFHAIAGMNETTSIITGGITSANSANNPSPLTWFFNHVSQQFQAGPSLITGRWNHASATIQDHQTNEHIVVVFGGATNNGEEVPALDSTELLINGETEWQQGTGPSLNTQSCIKGLLVVWDYFFWAVWAAGPVMKKKLGANNKQLMRAVFFMFWGETL